VHNGVRTFEKGIPIPKLWRGAIKRFCESASSKRRKRLPPEIRKKKNIDFGGHSRDQVLYHQKKNPKGRKEEEKYLGFAKRGQSKKR